MGIWQAAIATSKTLFEKFDIRSEVWFPKREDNLELQSTKYCKFTEFPNGILRLNRFLKAHDILPENSVVVTHSSWKRPTWIGYLLKRKGFKWIHTPHGTLEPWSISQKRFKKHIYLSLIEKRLSNKADLLVAVSKKEQENLDRLYPNIPIKIIPNCVDISPLPERNHRRLNFLFMARLHHKKGIIPLLQSWNSSEFNQSDNCKLTIAGPDGGELKTIQSLLGDSKNAEYVGVIRGEEKEQWFANSDFFVLPSFSEGFPTAVLEAMQAGLIPLISKGCNFEEAIEKDLTIPVEPDEQSIIVGLRKAVKLSSNQRGRLSRDAAELIQSHYSVERISEMQCNMYKELINGES